jgi:ATPase family protein associated with various cellular activities (AAA)
MLLGKGMEGIQAEANTIFRMLAQTDSIVVLFDEFDELVRERGSSRGEQPFSRLLTTAMLPKLADMHRRSSLVFIIATNNIAEFDLAISREGRFDRVVQVMPPTFEAKIAYKTWGSGKDFDFEVCFNKFNLLPDEDLERKVGGFTYGETESLADDLSAATSPQNVLKAVNDLWSKCTLMRHVPKAHTRSEDEITWRERCEAEKIWNR